MSKVRARCHPSKRLRDGTETAVRNVHGFRLCLQRPSSHVHDTYLENKATSATRGSKPHELRRGVQCTHTQPQPVLMQSMQSHRACDEVDALCCRDRLAIVAAPSLSPLGQNLRKLDNVSTRQLTPRRGPVICAACVGLCKLRPLGLMPCTCKHPVVLSRVRWWEWRGYARSMLRQPCLLRPLHCRARRS